MFQSLKLDHRIRALLTVGLTASLISGCQSIRPQTVQHTIQNESSYNTASNEWIDSNIVLYPVESYGIRTFPIETGFIPDGIRRGNGEKPELFDLIDISVSDKHISIQQDSVISVFKLPVKGESLHIRNAEEMLQGWLAGEPEDIVIDVDVPQQRSLFEEIRETLKWIFLILVLGLVGFGAFVFYKARRSKRIIRGITDIATDTLTQLTNNRPKK